MSFPTVVSGEVGGDSGREGGRLQSSRVARRGGLLCRESSCTRVGRHGQRGVQSQAGK